MNKRAKAHRAAQAAHERQMRQQRRQRRQRTVWVSALAVTVVLIAGLIGAAVWQSNRPQDVTVPEAATVDGAGLPVGSGPVPVEIYLDLLCPSCAAFDQAARPTLARYLDDGTVTVVYRPIAILDDRTTTEYSTRAGAAVGCAADARRLDEFVAVMLTNQPAEDTAGLSDEEIIAFGGQAGLSESDFGACVRAGDYRDWMDENTDQAFDRGVQGTPTVFVDGQPLEQPSVEALVAAIDAAAAEASAPLPLG